MQENVYKNGGEKSHKCNNCSFSTASKRNLQIHKEVQLKYKQCSYEGNQKISVYNDLWIKCDCCDYKASQKIL